MPRTLWEVASERGLLVGDRGEGLVVALTARKNKKKPIMLRYHRVAGTIGNDPLPVDHLRSWEQPDIDVPDVEAELARRLEAGRFIDRLSALQPAFSLLPST